MASAELVFTKLDILKDTKMYQTDDGTIFYHEYNCCPQRIYVKWQGVLVTTKQQLREFTIAGTYGNALYFLAQGKFYKAQLSEVDSISISILREKRQDERILFGTLCTRKVDGIEYVYRMGADALRDGVQVDVSEKKRKNLELKCIHRGRLVYIRQEHTSGAAKISDLSDNAILLEISSQPLSEFQVFARDFSPILYITNKVSGLLFICDTNRKTFMRTLRFRPDSDVVGFHNGKMTIISNDYGQSFAFTAQLPNENFSQSDFCNREKTQSASKLEKLEDWHEIEEQKIVLGWNSQFIQNGHIENDMDELREPSEEVAFKLARKEKLNEELQKTINKTVNELLKSHTTIEDLTEELRRLKDHNEEVETATAEVFDENKELKRRNAELSEALRERQSNAEAAEQRNAELQAEMDQMQQRMNDQKQHYLDVGIQPILPILPEPPAHDFNEPIREIIEMLPE